MCGGRHFTFFNFKKRVYQAHWHKKVKNLNKNLTCKKMTQLQAYNPMAKLFQIYYELDSSGDLCEILAVINFLEDKKLLICI